MPTSSTGPSRRSAGINTEAFNDLVDEALEAFGSDVSYAVSMSRAAAAIKRKREVWTYRLELRAAEREAREECESVVPFSCKALSPCGTGDCRFAKGDFAKIMVPECPGTKYRPQMDSTGQYSLEPALKPLKLLRESEQQGA